MTTCDTPRDRSAGRGDGPTEGYEWTCPFCGKSRISTAGGEAGEQNAIAALRSHILASVGADHGPRNELPPTGSLTLSDHVVWIEDRT